MGRPAWDAAGVPHEGWTCVDIGHLRTDGGPADETDCATCQMCGNEKFRYVHIMEHPDPGPEPEQSAGKQIQGLLGSAETRGQLTPRAKAVTVAASGMYAYGLVVGHCRTGDTT